MQQLDQVTQQNAAGSEELAATAEEMRSQSQSLIEMISFFKLQSSASNMHSRAANSTPSSFNASASKLSIEYREPAETSADIDVKQFKRF